MLTIYSYQYRFLGSSNEWQTTSKTFVEFRALSAGHYTFEVAVLDKQGKRSKEIATLSFVITPPFYLTWWFGAFVFALAIGYYLIKRRFELRRKIYEREQELNMKIIELEQQALKAQMNPHFIFNCLASIQHFINKDDPDSANRYLSNFSKLIRKTLDLSGEQYITLEKEISYLRNYVQMEKMRFLDKFQYRIDVDPFIVLNAVFIPPMLIQPLVENAIKHGLRYKEKNDGVLRISFTLSGNDLLCIVDDNGIGIKRSNELKVIMNIDHISKGTRLTDSRIQALNMTGGKKIKMDIHDKYDAKGNATGTRVTLIFEQAIK
jgi:LytS/YehU family sensor histidine kinase